MAEPVGGTPNDSEANGSQEWRLKKYQFYLGVAGLALTILGMAISFWFSLQSFRMARDTQQRQATAEAWDAIRSTPLVEVSYTVAASPDLSDLQDQRWLSRHGYDTLIHPNAYYNEQLGEYRRGTAADGSRYLFILFKNTGLGPARQVILEELTWEPEAGEEVPTGLAELAGGATLGPLDRQVYYMILVAASAELETGRPLAGTSARSICLEYSYSGFFTDTVFDSPPYCLGEPEEQAGEWIKIDPEAAETPE